jgi:uncharacterized protein YciI
VLFHIRLTDYPVSRRKAELSPAHQKYLNERNDWILVRGPTQNDEGTQPLAGVFFIDVADRAAAERFAAEEPYNNAGCMMSVEIFGWGNPLKRRMTDFPRKDGQVYWYIRGYAKPGAHLKRQALFEAHQAYFKPYDAEHFIARGGVTDNDGTWVGSANLICLPDRKAAEAFAAEEPFCKNGLFERVLIERFKMGAQQAPST